MKQVSTAVSDFVLAMGCVYALYQICQVASSQSILFAIFAYLMFLVGAVLGCIRFSQEAPTAMFIKCHEVLTWLSTTIGLSMMAAQLQYAAGWDLVGHLHLVSILVLLAIKMFWNEVYIVPVSETISMISVASMLVCAIVNKSLDGCLGTALFIVMGCMKGRGGEWFGLPRVDIFHYVITIGLIFLSFPITAHEEYDEY